MPTTTTEIAARHTLAVRGDLGRRVGNRGAGPFGLLNLLGQRYGGVFEEIDAVIPAQEREEFMSRYRAAAGFAKEPAERGAANDCSGAEVAARRRRSSQGSARAPTCQSASLQIPQLSPAK